MHVISQILSYTVIYLTLVRGRLIDNVDDSVRKWDQTGKGLNNPKFYLSFMKNACV